MTSTETPSASVPFPKAVPERVLAWDLHSLATALANGSLMVSKDPRRHICDIYLDIEADGTTTILASDSVIALRQVIECDEAQLCIPTEIAHSVVVAARRLKAHKSPVQVRLRLLAEHPWVRTWQISTGLCDSDPWDDPHSSAWPAKAEGRAMIRRPYAPI